MGEAARPHQVCVCVVVGWGWGALTSVYTLVTCNDGTICGICCQALVLEVQAHSRCCGVRSLEKVASLFGSSMSRRPTPLWAPHGHVA